MKEEEGDDRKINDDKFVQDIKLWGVFLFGLIGATATTFAVSSTPSLFNFIYNHFPTFFFLSVLCVFRVYMINLILISSLSTSNHHHQQRFYWLFLCYSQKCFIFNSRNGACVYNYIPVYVCMYIILYSVNLRFLLGLAFGRVKSNS